jgi:hypothetical protein
LVGENRLLSLLKSNHSVLMAARGQYDEALRMAEDAHNQGGSATLLYLRFEALRCLADVRFRRALAGITTGGGGVDELSEGERLCKMADELVARTESRVSQLWLGPLYVDVLLEQRKRAKAENDDALAEQRLSEAKQRLGAYQELVLHCQSPRFNAEAQRLASSLGNAWDSH